MARETKAAKAQRTAADNAAAALLPLGTTIESWLFGTITLGENLGPYVDPTDPSNSSQGWDIYDVEHSGVHHRWSSASVLTAFGA